jgi:hypothetical protein
MSTPEPPPPQTVSRQINASLIGFAETEETGKFSRTLAETIELISGVINLERLDGITIAFDYDAAMASLDRGFTSTQPLKKTSSDLLLGVAMSPTVLRNGIVKAHMIFHAPFITPLVGEDEQLQRQACYLLAHESGHVEGIKHLDTAFPGRILCPIKTNNHFLFQIAEGLWSEYCACRISAVFGEDQTVSYENSLVSVLKIASERANAAIWEYRFHGDLEKVVQEAGNYICHPLKIGAYFLGHLDGLKLDLNAVPAAQTAMRETQYELCMKDLHDALRGLWSRLGCWSDVAEFDVLGRIAHQAMAERGMIFRNLADGTLYLEIP